MSRINPLHIIALLVVVLLFFMFKLGSAKDELAQTKKLYKKALVVSNELKGFKNIYADSIKVKKSLQRLFAQPSLRNLDLQKKFTSGGVVLSSENMDKKALNSLMGKLLNGSYNIDSFKIKRLNPQSVSFKMEIKW